MAGQVPCILIAGTQSGVGKSTISLALVAALRRRGLKVQTFKVGPDYLDPGHLTRVSDRPCYNLDSWICDPGYLRQLFADATADCDFALVEGVMGLFDGSSASSLSGSSAEVAALLDIPVLLVVNSHGMARSLAALVQGYNGFDPAVRLAGVLANRCGSTRHAELLREALETSGQPTLLGTIPRDAFPQLQSRHLGLVSAVEQILSEQMIDQLADVAEQHIEIDLLLKQQGREAHDSRETRSVSTADSGTGVRLGVAWDEAFQFYYPDLFPALEVRGCHLQFFSPLHDDQLPDDLDGIYFGGGYPEVYAQALSANSSMLRAVQVFCQSGRPVYAECGGLIYLSRGLENDGELVPLVGHLPVATRMLDKRKALGYVTATLTSDSLFGCSGSAFRGHEFHYSELTSDPVGRDGWMAVYQLKQNRTGEVFAEGYQKGSVLASYAHLHLASQPCALDRFVAMMKSMNQITGEF